jgi:Argininosuccinate lyase C-terminal
VSDKNDLLRHHDLENYLTPLAEKPGEQRFVHVVAVKQIGGQWEIRVRHARSSQTVFDPNQWGHFSCRIGGNCQNSEWKKAIDEALQTAAPQTLADGALVRDLEPESRMRVAAGDGFATATDLADWLTCTLKLPFREAHHVTGRIVAKAAEACVPLDQADARRHAGDRAPYYQGRLRRTLGRGLGQKPRRLWRYRAEKTCAQRWLKRLKK